MSFEQKRISVGSIVFYVSIFKKRQANRSSIFGAGNRWVVEGFALFISGTYFPSYSPKQFSPRSLWIVFFSHWRYFVYWFDARVIFQNPSIDFRQLGASIPKHQASSSSCSGDARRYSTQQYCCSLLVLNSSGIPAWRPISILSSSWGAYTS